MLASSTKTWLRSGRLTVRCRSPPSVRRFRWLAVQERQYDIVPGVRDLNGHGLVHHRQLENRPGALVSHREEPALDTITIAATTNPDMAIEVLRGER